MPLWKGRLFLFNFAISYYHYWLLFYCKRKHLRFTRNSRATVTINETVRLANMSINLNRLTCPLSLNFQHQPRQIYLYIFLNYPHQPQQAYISLNYQEETTSKLPLCILSVAVTGKRFLAFFCCKFWVICNMSENRNNDKASFFGFYQKRFFCTLF